MQADVEEKLLAINREFYQTFADAFADSRSQPRPGTSELLSDVGPEQPVIDLGCGNGALADALYKRGHVGFYLGLDYSHGLLQRAQQDCRHQNAEFHLADLAQPNWADSVGNRRFPWAFSLALLHHIPGAQRRQEWAGQLQQILTQDAQVGVSVWNFPVEERWRQRVLPWTTVGLRPDQVEPGDALLDWRRDGHGLRYVHHLNVDELQRLAQTAGCRVVQQFESGGRSGQLNRLQLWQRQHKAEDR